MAIKKYLFFISQDYSFPVLRPLQEEIKRRGDSVQWFLYGDEIHASYLHDDEKVLATIKDVISYHPDAVFVPGNVVPSFIPGLKVEVFHGLPGGKTRKNGAVYHYIIRGMFDLYCTQGPSSTTRFKELSQQYGYFQVTETGWSKLDPLFLEHTPPCIQTNKSIFFASTFSPRYSKAETLYPFLLKMMEKYDFQWYITLHPKMDDATYNKYKAIPFDNVTFIETTQLIPAMKASDIMLCDISSIVYEYMTQIKPVITFQSPQESHAIINVDSLDALEDTLVQMLHTPPENLTEIIKAEVAQFHPYHDGKSSQRVLNYVEKMLQGEEMPKKKKPLNILRNLKLRKALGYWKFI